MTFILTGMITRREAERLCKSFLGDNAPPRLPDDFAFAVHHECAWGCRGAFLPARYLVPTPCGWISVGKY